ncbi:hypothetical protein BKH18_03410 [Actinomyces oris]|nr:hypothetical protein BKH18_03410 [Actinomyces oris]
MMCPLCISTTGLLMLIAREMFSQHCPGFALEVWRPQTSRLLMPRVRCLRRRGLESLRRLGMVPVLTWMRCVLPCVRLLLSVRGIRLS